MYLFKNFDVYSPFYMGKQNILVSGNKIISISKETPTLKGIELKIINGSNKILVPGFIDCHIHIAGAGGEGGPGTRTPEVHISDLIKSGITSVVGCLGTDGITRNIESVVMKAKAIKSEGLSCFAYTGAYQVPVPTITGNISKDIILIEEIIGVGEVAISDHRSSCPTNEELKRIASHARLGGMLSGKSGIVNIHMGDAKKPFTPLLEVEKHSELNRKVFLPTHINRNKNIFEDSKSYGKKGFIDITTSSYPFFKDVEIKPSKAYKELIEAGVSEYNITMSSDACGSLPDFDKNGRLIKLKSSKPDSNLREFRDLVKIEKIPIEKSLLPFTTNPANILKLKNKGQIKNNYDADFLILDENLELDSVFANGNIMMKDNEMVHICQI